MRYRRRIVRTFEFNRIFLFASAICFAVALFAVLLSVTPGAAYSAVNARVVYFVTYAQASGDDDAASKAEECQSRGGAGYLYVKDSVVYTVAAAYSTESDAAKIANTIDGGQVKAVKIGKLRISKSDGSENICDILSFCAYTVADELSENAAAVDKRTMSAAAALEKCRLLKADVERLAASLTGNDTASAAVKAFAQNVVDELERALSSDKSVQSRLRYAVCATTVLAEDAIAAAQRG